MHGDFYFPQVFMGFKLDEEYNTGQVHYYYEGSNSLFKSMDNLSKYILNFYNSFHPFMINHYANYHKRGVDHLNCDMLYKRILQKRKQTFIYLVESLHDMIKLFSDMNVENIESKAYLIFPFEIQQPYLPWVYQVYSKLIESITPTNVTTSDFIYTRYFTSIMSLIATYRKDLSEQHFDATELSNLKDPDNMFRMDCIQYVSSIMNYEYDINQIDMGKFNIFQLSKNTRTRMDRIEFLIQTEHSQFKSNSTLFDHTFALHHIIQLLIQLTRASNKFLLHRAFTEVLPRLLLLYIEIYRAKGTYAKLISLNKSDDFQCDVRAIYHSVKLHNTEEQVVGTILRYIELCTLKFIHQDSTELNSEHFNTVVVFTIACKYALSPTHFSRIIKHLS